MADLNAHLEEPVPMDRFRPNIVLEGDQEPWAEDQWGGQKLQVQCQQGGQVDLELCKPCSRCTVRSVTKIPFALLRFSTESGDLVLSMTSAVFGSF